MHRFSLFLILVLLCIFKIILAFAANISLPIIYQPGKEAYMIKDHAFVFRDPTSKLTIKDLVSQPQRYAFKPFDYQNFNRYPNVTTWLVFQVTNPTNESIELFLDGEGNRDNTWKFYEKDAQGNYVNTIYADGPYNETVFQFTLPALTTEVFYLSRFTEGVNHHAGKFTIRTLPNYITKMNQQYLLFGIIYSIPIALMLYSFFIYIFTKKTNYLIYILFGICFIIFQALDDGILNIFFKITNWWYIRISIASILFGAYFYLLFARNILRAHYYAPRVYQVTNIFLFLILPLLIYSYAIKITPFLGIMYLSGSLILSFILACIAVSRHYMPASYYFVGMVSVIIGIVISFLVYLNLFPENIYTSRASQLALCLDLILQSMALASQLNLLQKQKHLAQANLIKQKDINAENQRKAIEAQKLLISAYERFVPKNFLNLLDKKSITEINLGDEIEKDMTVMFIDVRNFTTIIEKKRPIEGFNFINSYLGKIGPIIRNHFGFIDKYIGDAVMALFEQSPNYVINAAINIFQIVPDVRVAEENFDIGIGIHYGTLMLGTIGETKRMDGTAISDTVNIASRLEQLNKAYGTHLIISEAVYNKLTNKKQFKIRYLDNVYVKGKKYNVKIFEIFDMDPPEIIEKKMSLLPIFNSGVEFYNAKNFEMALKEFNRCHEILSTDLPTVIYQHRCQAYLLKGVQEDWVPIVKLIERGNFEL